MALACAVQCTKHQYASYIACVNRRNAQTEFHDYTDKDSSQHN